MGCHFSKGFTVNSRQWSNANIAFRNDHEVSWGLRLNGPPVSLKQVQTLGLQRRLKSQQDYTLRRLIGNIRTSPKIYQLAEITIIGNKKPPVSVGLLDEFHVRR